MQRSSVSSLRKKLASNHIQEHLGPTISSLISTWKSKPSHNKQYLSNNIAENPVPISSLTLGLIDCYTPVIFLQSDFEPNWFHLSFLHQGIFCSILCNDYCATSTFIQLFLNSTKHLYTLTCLVQVLWAFYHVSDTQMFYILTSIRSSDFSILLSMPSTCTHILVVS